MSTHDHGASGFDVVVWIDQVYASGPGISHLFFFVSVLRLTRNFASGPGISHLGFFVSVLRPTRNFASGPGITRLGFVLGFEADQEFRVWVLFSDFIRPGINWILTRLLRPIGNTHFGSHLTLVPPKLAGSC